MNKTEKKRQYLESLYMQYRAGKAALNDILIPSIELDSLIVKYYTDKSKPKGIACKETLPG